MHGDEGVRRVLRRGIEQGAELSDSANPLSIEITRQRIRVFDRIREERDGVEQHDDEFRTEAVERRLRREEVLGPLLEAADVKSGVEPRLRAGYAQVRAERI